MNRWFPLGLVVLLAIGGAWLFLKDTKETEVQPIETRIVIDGADKEIEIPAKPQRVVIISAAGIGMYLAVGGEMTLVGHIESGSFSPEELEKLAKSENVGKATGANLEKILSLKPDLVIGVEVPFQRQLEDPLKEAGIPLWLLKANNIEDNMSILKIFGELTGGVDQADKEILKIKNAISDAAARKGDKEIRVLPIFGTPESFMIAMPTSMGGDILRLAGLVNIADNLKGITTGAATMNYVPFSLEFVIQENPDQIMFITHGDPEEMKKSLQENMATNAAWLSISAVKEGRVFVVPMELYALNPGIQSSKAITDLSKLLQGQDATQ